jgi:hypothetical protein
VTGKESGSGSCDGCHDALALVKLQLRAVTRYVRIDPEILVTLSVSGIST